MGQVSKTRFSPHVRGGFDLNMKTIHKAYRTKLRTNNRQQALFRQCAGTARYVYNWALADRIEHYEAGTPTTYYKQKKRFNAVKDELCPWIRQYPYTITESAFRNLDAAYQNFFRRIKQGAEQKGFPKFKSKRSRKSFAVRGVVIEHDQIRLPNLGWFRLNEKGYLPEGRYTSEAVTISEDGGDWYASIAIEIEQSETNGHNGPIGIDLGIKELATCSDGTVFENPQTLRQYEKKLARLSRELSRRQKGSQGWKETRAKINKLHAKIRRTRRHGQHNASKHVTERVLPSVIVLEDLNVSGMVHNRHLAKSISDAGMSELARQIGYKAEWYDIEVMKADRWFPSSKACSRCGVIKDELLLSERTFICDSCGLEIDRDLNAAINLAALGEPVSDGGLPVELG